ncbi:MAG: (2Fe-2S)-binding protein, partial [Chloroflexi bacterium]|nr:(2Fe-2S)-binding protein [Chloroflexota bacterium]
MTQATNPQDPPPPPDTVTLTVNGRSVSARKGTLPVEAAKQAGIEIPVFCYHEKLKSVGACRMCLVSIEKMPRLQTACTTPVAADMVVHSDSPEAIAAQNGVIELLLANHPLDCPICDKGGECPLQDNTYGFGLGRSRFTENKRHLEKAFPLGERIVLDRERCIMCYRCVRFHQEIPGDEALAAVERGGDTFIGTLPGETYSSIFSGNTIELCPVGALTSRQYRFKARPWDLVRTPSVCDGCSVGCNLEVHSRVESVLRLVARENDAVDGGWLCDRGRFDTLPVGSERHTVQPLVRVAGGSTEAVSWRRAIDRTLELIGPAPGVLVSPHLSNEAIWLIANRVLPQLGGAPAALWPDVGGNWPVEGAITNLLDSRRIVLVGLDVWNELPVLALWIRKAVDKGARLVVIGAANGLFRDTAHWLQTESSAGNVLDTVDALHAALAAANGASGEVAAAAGSLSGAGEGPAALLVHPSLLKEAGAEERLRALAEAIGARGDSGLVGAPQLAANARGAHELAPALAGADPATVLDAAAGGQLSSLLLFGNEPWAELDTGQARLIVASTVLPDGDPRVDVVLPLAHAYESQGTITNFEGRVQRQ